MSLQFKSLDQLIKESLNYQYNEQLSMTFYFKLCNQLLNKTIAIFDYQQWKNKIKSNDKLSENLITNNGMEWCFILQMRYLDLMNNRLTYHSQFVLEAKNASSLMVKKEFISRMQNEVPFVIENVEWLKEKLKNRYIDLQNYKEKELLKNKQYMELKHLKEHVKDENTLRKNILIKQQLTNSTDEYPINIELSRQKQLEKDRFLQSIKRKNSQQELQQLTMQNKKIKYGIEDLVSSLSSNENNTNNASFSTSNSTVNPGYVLPVLTPHNSNDNLVSLPTSNLAKSTDADLIKYSLPKL
ncbi:hypothetical protein HANVADRAFT_52319 [Hanseniaspora valbyensis NRRL Y-1626]|uniref:Uncharacterized protein n=1 Tax=Hanseniaspora valbyensis NRRL Y-1626 TaxID=766949 RepID=A0A1B7TEW8_9ASCO|nr:hypothetical protein HANVADRAFT_52319 [Hanseniaspora valbyensis NRRL Y-1626]